MLRHVNLYTKSSAQAHPDDMGADVLQSAQSLVDARSTAYHITPNARVKVQENVLSGTGRSNTGVYAGRFQLAPPSIFQPHSEP
jgi:hypothetical protein